MITLPFDAHNHVQLGPSPPSTALLPPSSDKTQNTNDAKILTPALCGMAIMSTHPRDYEKVIHLTETLPTQVEPLSPLATDLPQEQQQQQQTQGVRIVPCFGVHPWFLHELTEEDWHASPPSSTIEEDQNETSSSLLPKWIVQLEETLKAHPNAIVGEIGLDGFHFCPHTKELTCPMDVQVKAFQYQLEVAARLERPVSIHTVQCFGPLMEVLTKLKKKKLSKKQQRKQKQQKSSSSTTPLPTAPSLPPKWYFHAYGGKVGTIDQLLALCGTEIGQVYFGFAPIINFRSPKTADVIRKVGLQRLVLETDHEDANRVPYSMEQCINFISDTLQVDRTTVIEQTTANAFDLYGLN